MQAHVSAFSPFKIFFVIHVPSLFTPKWMSGIEALVLDGFLRSILTLIICGMGSDKKKTKQPSFDPDCSFRPWIAFSKHGGSANSVTILEALACEFLLPFLAPIWSIPYLAISKGFFLVATAVLFKSHLQHSLQAMLKSAFVFENKALKAARGATQKSRDFVTMA